MKFQISLFRDHESESQCAQEVVEVTFDELPPYVTTRSWSSATFNLVRFTDKHGAEHEGMRRTKDNMIQLRLLALDVDGGCTVEDAKERFKEYKFMIATSRNHQKVKHPGTPSEQPACDRFRVILSGSPQLIQ